MDGTIGAALNQGRVVQLNLAVNARPISKQCVWVRYSYDVPKHAILNVVLLNTVGGLGRKKEALMASPASIAKHPLHPMLVALPIGLWIFSLISDVIYVMEWGGRVWYDVAFYTMAGGLAGALLAAVPGLIDLLSMSSGKVKAIGIWHMCINLLVVALFAVNLWLRYPSTQGVAPPIWLSVIGVVLLGVSGWLGGEMVYVHGVAVEPQGTAAQQGGADQSTPRRAA